MKYELLIYLKKKLYLYSYPFALSHLKTANSELTEEMS